MLGAPLNTNALANGEECNLLGFGGDTGTEAVAQVSATEACTFSDLGININSGGSGTNSLRFRKAGAPGNQLAEIAGAGVVEDAVNTDVLAAADLFNLAYADTGTDSVYSWVKGNVEFSSGHGCFHGSANYAGTVHDVASTNSFLGLGGSRSSDGTTTEDNVAFKSRANDTYEALQVRVTANARLNTSTFTNRINLGAGTASVPFDTLVTGLVVDTGVGDAIPDGQVINAAVALGTGVQDLTVAFVIATLKSSTSKQEVWAASQGGVARAASATAHYIAISGHISALGSYTEAQARAKPGFAGVAGNLRCYLSANTYGGAGTLKLMQNGSAVLTTTIGAGGGAGWYENTADSVSFDDNDEFSFEFDEGTSGDITIHMVGITFAPAAGGAAGGLLLPWVAAQSNVLVGGGITS